MIYVTNKSTRVSDADVKAMTAAVYSQLWYHVAPAWRRATTPVLFTSTPADAPAGSYVIAVMDSPDQADTLGWHTESQGELIYGRVFCGPVLDHGGDALHRSLSVASVLSHEVLEAFVDPNCNLWAERGDGTVVALEIGDPVESDSYALNNGITVSNFVTPRWFDPNANHNGRFDWLGKTSQPFQMTKGGYVVLMEEGNVTQQFGEEYPDWRRDSKKVDVARTARRLHCRT